MTIFIAKPFDGEFIITQEYGENPDSYPYTGGHPGTDYALYVGVPVLAAADGQIIFASLDTTGYGLRISILHNGFETLYGHLSKLADGISVGVYVTRGQIIGYSGGALGDPNAGRSTGPHLHFGLKILALLNGIMNGYVNPIQYMGEVSQDISIGDSVSIASGITMNIRSEPKKIGNSYDISNNIVGSMKGGIKFNVLDVAEEAEGSRKWVKLEVWVCSQEGNSIYITR